MSLLEVKNLSKSYKDTTIINNISFSVEKGEILSVLGPSGVGKTTLMRCLNFLEIADKGSITVKGKKIYEAGVTCIKDNKLKEMRSHFGLVFQSFNLFPQYTVLENICLAPRLKGLNKNKEALKLLEKLDLSDKFNAYPHELSGGMKQRVAIARAMILEPEILCFDEPTSALDSKLVDEIARLIKSLKDLNCAIIIVTHDTIFASKVSDKVMTLKNGSIEKIEESKTYFAK